MLDIPIHCPIRNFQNGIIHKQISYCGSFGPFLSRKWSRKSIVIGIDTRIAMTITSEIILSSWTFPTVFFPLRRSSNNKLMVPNQGISKRALPVIQLSFTGCGQMSEIWSMTLLLSPLVRYPECVQEGLLFRNPSSGILISHILILKYLSETIVSPAR